MEGQRPARDEMTAEEIEHVARVAARLGVRWIKLTGGEPLLREDICEIVERLSRIRGVEDVSLSTNGVLLADLAEELARAGLSRVNVSLDTLDSEKYKAITGVDAHEKVIEGIKAAVRAGLRPVKVNMVLLKGINDSELWDMIDFCRRIGAALQIIELVPTPTKPSPWFTRYHADLSRVEEELAREALLVSVRSAQRRRRYLLRGGIEVEIVRPFHNSDFCMHCVALRLTADGKLKPCLMRNDNLVDVLGPLRRGASDKEIAQLIKLANSLREPFYRPPKGNA